MSILKDLAQVIIVGHRDGNAAYLPEIVGKPSVVKLVNQALAEGVGLDAILQQGMIVGMDVVGKRYSAGEYFLPNLLVSAQAMKDTGRYDLYIRTSSDNGYIVLSVKDQGHGIDFCRECSINDCVRCKNFAVGKSKKKDGTGIGVVYVQQIMKELRGKMKFDSVIGSGTTVSLYFPSAESGQEPRDAAASE